LSEQLSLQAIHSPQNTDLYQRCGFNKTTGLKCGVFPQMHLGSKKDIAS